MNNVIQQLKDNEKPFKYWSEEMQAEAKGLPWKCFQVWGYVEGKEKWIMPASDTFSKSYTYRLRPDYAEKPEIVEIAIKQVGLSLTFLKDDNLRPVHAAPEYPDFIGFKAHGWIWGCLYRNKKDPSMVHYMIKETDLPLYDVISMVGGNVLFRKINK